MGPPGADRFLEILANVTGPTKKDIRLLDLGGLLEEEEEEAVPSLLSGYESESEEGSRSTPTVSAARGVLQRHRPW